MRPDVNQKQIVRSSSHGTMHLHTSSDVCINQACVVFKCTVNNVPLIRFDGGAFFDFFTFDWIPRSAQPTKFTVTVAVSL